MKIKLLSMITNFIFIESWYSWPVILVMLLLILVVVLASFAIKFAMEPTEGLYNINVLHFSKYT